jgi:hypothetical protein
MTRVFPRMTKCIYKKFGASGTIQTHDALCILPINVINEKGGSKQAESKDDILKWRLCGIFGLDIRLFFRRTVIKGTTPTCYYITLKGKNMDFKTRKSLTIFFKGL